MNAFNVLQESWSSVELTLDASLFCSSYFLCAQIWLVNSRKTVISFKSLTWSVTGVYCRTLVDPLRWWRSFPTSSVSPELLNFQRKDLFVIDKWISVFINSTEVHQHSTRRRMFYNNQKAPLSIQGFKRKETEETQTNGQIPNSSIIH